MSTFDMRCPGCGEAFGRGDRFCRSCGLSLVSRAGIQEHRYITALYSDLNRYTSLSALLDPEELKTIMDKIFQEASRIIASFGGVVEKFLGDAVVALYGVYHINENDIVHAIRSAVAIHAFVKENMQDFSNEKLTMHTGIHTGTVLVDHQSVRNLSLGAMGMPINVAARLSSLAAPGEILICKTALPEAERFFHTEFMGEKGLKGILEPMSVYRINSIRQTPLSLHRPDSARLPFVGREEQLSLLRKAGADLLLGRGASFVITGEAGVGKSRLIHESLNTLPSGSVTLLIQCLDHMKDTPYDPLISLVRQVIGHMGVERSEPDRIIEECIPNPRHAFHIRSLLGNRQDGVDLMPDIWKTEMFEAITALVQAFCQERPLVICIEDVHWADATTIDFLQNLTQLNDRGIHCLLIITSRVKDSMHSPGITLNLQELSREYAWELILVLLEDTRLSEGLFAFLYRTTGGNPFFISEYVSYLKEKDIVHLLERKEKRSGLIPSTIHGLLAARMEGLGNACKNILQAASVIGMVFSRDLLMAITINEPEADGILEVLEKAGFIQNCRDNEYCFRHALTKDVAYITLLKRRRLDLHCKIALHLEKSSKTRTENYGIVAYHFYHAHEYAKACPYYILAARIYQAEGTWIEAAAQYLKAKECLQKTADLPDGDESLIMVLEGIWSCSRVFDPDLAISALEELGGIFKKSGHKGQEAFSQIRLINLYSQKAKFQEALDRYDDVLTKTGGNDLLVAAAKTAVAYTYTFLGKPIIALQYLEEARSRLDLSDKFLLSVNYLTTLTAYVWRGCIKEAFVWHSRVKEQSSPYLDLDLMADVWLGYIFFLKGGIAEGQKVFDEIRFKEVKLGSIAGGLSYLRIQSSIYLYSRYTGWLDKAREEIDMLECQKNKSRKDPFFALHGLYRAWIALEHGQYQAARDLLEEALPLLETGIVNRVPYALNALAETYLKLEDFGKAVEIAGKCIAWNRENGNMDQLIWAWRIYGASCFKIGKWEEARDSLISASRLAWTLQMKPHIAWTIEVWGDYHAAKGKLVKAKACYARSISLWMAMENPYQARKIETKISS